VKTFFWKYLTALAISAGVFLMLTYKQGDFDFDDAIWLVMIIVVVSSLRAAEFMLNLPMKAPSSNGFIKSWSSIPKEKIGQRLFILIIHLALSAAMVYLYLTENLI